MKEKFVLFQNQPVRHRPKPRRKLLERSTAQHLPSLHITERDVAIVNACYEYRALTTPQIQCLFFTVGNGRGQLVQCRERLKRLYHHGYLYRDEQPTRLTEGRRSLVYFLDRKGASFLADYTGIKVSDLDWRPLHNVAGAGYLFLNHLLKTNDVRIAVTLAAQNAGGHLMRWLDDKALQSRQMKDSVTLWDVDGKKRTASVVPDGYFQLHLGENRYADFLEVDMRTTIGVYTKPGRRDWARKVRIYLTYHAEGMYSERYQTQAFRVLTVTTGERRLDNLKRITEGNGGGEQFWFTTFDRLNPETALTQPIWHVAGQGSTRSLVW